jgi:hypothetical protein
MYRDCLKTVKHMTPNQTAQKNIAKHFRIEFDKQKTVTCKDKHQEFREGITRLLSNYILYDIRKQYEENPHKFNEPVNIHSEEDQAREESELNDKAAEIDYKPPFI